MPYRPTDAEIVAAANEICVCHSGRSLEMSSPPDRLDYKTAAIKALLAAEKVRAAKQET